MNSTNILKPFWNLEKWNVWYTVHLNLRSWNIQLKSIYVQSVVTTVNWTWFRELYLLHLKLDTYLLITLPYYQQRSKVACDIFHVFTTFVSNLLPTVQKWNFSWNVIQLRFDFIHESIYVHENIVCSNWSRNRLYSCICSCSFSR